MTYISHAFLTQIQYKMILRVVTEYIKYTILMIISVTNQVCGVAFSITKWFKITVLCYIILLMSKFFFDYWLLNSKGLLKTVRIVMVDLSLLENALNFHCNNLLHDSEFLLHLRLIFPKILCEAFLIFHSFLSTLLFLHPECQLFFKIFSGCMTIIAFILVRDSIRPRDSIKEERPSVELEVLWMSMNISSLICKVIGIIIRICVYYEEMRCCVLKCLVQWMAQQRYSINASSIFIIFVQN